MKNLILIGAGGHARSCIDVIEQEGKYKILGLIDLPQKIGEKILNYEIIDCDDNLAKYINSENYFLITIGQIKSAQKRIEIFNKLKSLNANIATVISPLSYVSKYAEIGFGTIVMHHALINVLAKIGENCIINSKALVEHDAIVESHCHISTGAIVNGETKIGEKTFMGSNSTASNLTALAPSTFLKAGGLVK